MPPKTDQLRVKHVPGAPRTRSSGEYTAHARPEPTTPMALIGTTDIDVAADWEATPAQLRALSWSKSPRVRDAVSGNPNTPRDVLVRYLDIQLGNRRTILKNSALGDDLIKAMIEKPHTRFGSGDLQAIAGRPDLTPELMSLVVDRGHTVANTVIASRWDLDADLAERMLRTSARQVAQTLAENELLPQDLRARAAQRAADLIEAFRTANPA